MRLTIHTGPSSAAGVVANRRPYSGSMVPYRRVRAGLLGMISFRSPGSQTEAMGQGSG